MGDADRKVFIEVQFDDKGAAAKLIDLDQKADKLGRTAGSAGGGVSQLESALSKATMTGSFLGTALERISEKVISWGVNLVSSSMMAGARLQQLAGVADYLGEKSGYSAAQVNDLADKMRKTGITGQEAYNAIIQFTRYGFDLNDMLKLQAAAQNSASIAGMNSSQVLGTLIQGITTLQPELLRSAGYTVSLEQVEKSYAATTGKAATSLSEHEKQQMLLNAVLKQATDINGVYGLSMTFAAKQAESSVRAWQQVEEEIGTKILPITDAAYKGWYHLGEGVRDFVKDSDAMKVVGSIVMTLVGSIGTLVKIVGALGAAWAAMKVEAMAAAAVNSVTSWASAEEGALAYCTSLKQTRLYLEQTTTAMGLTVEKLGLMRSATLIAADAFVAWEIGRFIAQITGADEAIARLVARLLGLGDVDAQTAGAQQDLIDRYAQQRPWILELTTRQEQYAAALKIAAEWQAKYKETGDLQITAEESQAAALKRTTDRMFEHEEKIADLMDRYRTWGDLTILAEREQENIGFASQLAGRQITDETEAIKIINAELMRLYDLRIQNQLAKGIPTPAPEGPKADVAFQNYDKMLVPAERLAAQQKILTENTTHYQDAIRRGGEDMKVTLLNMDKLLLSGGKESDILKRLEDDYGATDAELKKYKKDLEEGGKAHDKLSEKLQAAAYMEKSYADIIGVVGEQNVAAILSEHKLGLSAEEIADKHHLAKSAIEAFIEREKEEESWNTALEKSVGKASELAIDGWTKAKEALEKYVDTLGQKLIARLGEVNAAHKTLADYEAQQTETSTGYQIRLIEEEFTEKTKMLDRSKALDLDLYNTERKFADAKEAALFTDNQKLVSQSKQTLQETANREQAVLKAMTDEWWKYSKAAIAAQHGVVIAAQDAVSPNRYLEAFKADINGLAATFQAAFTGGGGASGAIKALGVSLGADLLKPMQLELHESEKAWMTLGIAGSTALGGLVGGGSGAAIGGVVSGLVSMVMNTNAAKAAFTAMGISGAAAMAVTTMGISLAVTGLIALVHHLTGPDGMEMAGRKVAATFESQFSGYTDMVTKVQAAFITLGSDADTAGRALQAMWTLEKSGADLTQLAVNALNNVLALAAQKTKAVAAAFDAVTVAGGKTFGVLTPAIRTHIADLLKLNGLTDDQKTKLQGLLDTGTDWRGLTKEAEKYGITLVGLGHTFQQNVSDLNFTDFKSTWDLLIQSGGDYVGMLNDASGHTANLATAAKMVGDKSSEVFGKTIPEALDYMSVHGELAGGAVGDMVTAARNAGVTVPLSMKPMLESMVTMGTLTDGAGGYLKNLDDIKFADADPLPTALNLLDTTLQTLIDALTGPEGLIAALATLNAVPLASKTADYNINYKFNGDPLDPGTPPPYNPDPAGTGGYMGGYVTPTGIRYYREGGNVLRWLPQGTDTVRAMLTPGEGVLNVKAMQKLGRGGLAYLNRGGSVDGLSAAAGGAGGPVQIVLVAHDGGKVLADALLPQMPAAATRRAMRFRG